MMPLLFLNMVMISLISVTINGCQYNIEGYGIVDFCSLSDDTMAETERDDGQWNVIYTPWRNIIKCLTLDGVNDTGMAAQVRSYNHASCNGLLAKYDVNNDIEPVLQTVVIQYNSTFVTETRLIFSYPNVPNVYSTGICKGRRLIVTYTCDRESIPFGNMLFYQGNRNKTNDVCPYYMNISSISACPAEPSTTSSPSSIVLSGGEVFLIILVIVIGMYCIFGYILNSVKHGDFTNVPQNIPHYMVFWKYLPDLVVAGCMFTFCCKKGNISSHQTLVNK